MPYYQVPQVVTRDKDGNIVEIKPQLPGGVSWRGDTDGTNYLVFCDQDVPGLIALDPRFVVAEMRRFAQKKGRHPDRVLDDVERWNPARTPLPRNTEGEPA